MTCTIKGTTGPTPKSVPAIDRYLATAAYYGEGEGEALYLLASVAVLENVVAWKQYLQVLCIDRTDAVTLSAVKCCQRLLVQLGSREAVMMLLDGWV